MKILLIDDEESITTSLGSFLEAKGYEVTAINDGEEALAAAARADHPIVVSDIYIDRVTGLDVLQAARSANPNVAVILMTARGSLGTAVEAEAGGVFDYLAKPVGLQQLLDVVQRAAKAQETSAPPEDLEPFDEEMLGTSPAMVELYKSIAAAARSEATALILGETGAGKERVAGAIHRHSARAKRPFVPVDCAAIPENLWESELFGVVRGAFTGADRDRPGVLRQADGGTVFLDEIGEIPLSFQSKLLRVLQGRDFRPVGAASPVTVDVRMVAATNRNLAEMVKGGTFREDLYHRLNVLRLTVPPLRDRRPDIALLARHFLHTAAQRLGRTIRLSPAAMVALEAHSWPGNVRELENTMERLVAACRTAEAGAADVRAALVLPEGGSGPTTLDDAERSHVLEAIRLSGGNITAAAARLGIQRRTLYKKLERWGELQKGHTAGSSAQEELDDSDRN
jgi:DNA-binding NtrC family response regulator